MRKNVWFWSIFEEVMKLETSFWLKLNSLIFFSCYMTTDRLYYQIIISSPACLNVRVQVVSFVSICCKQIKIKDKLEEKFRFTQFVTNLPLFYSDWDKKKPNAVFCKNSYKSKPIHFRGKKEQWSLMSLWRGSTPSL